MLFSYISAYIPLQRIRFDERLQTLRRK